MTDNVIVTNNQYSNNPDIPVATDEIGGKHYQKSKTVSGGNDAAYLPNDQQGYPVTMSGCNYIEFESDVGHTTTVLNIFDVGVVAALGDLIQVANQSSNPLLRRQTRRIVAISANQCTVEPPFTAVPPDFQGFFVLRQLPITVAQRYASNFPPVLVLGDSVGRPINVTDTGGLEVSDIRRFANTGTFAAVSVTTSNTTLAAADATREGVTIWNTHASSVIFVAYGFTATTSNYSAQVAPGDYLEVPTWASLLLINGIVASETATANVTKGT